MNLSDLISSNHVIAWHKASCKKMLLEDLAELASDSVEATSREIFDVLLQRERLGSTGVGNGVAIPHGKLPGLEQMVAIFARVEQPLDFDANDKKPVDLVCLLLAPEEAGADHLKALSRIARILRDGDMVQKIRDAEDDEEIHDLLSTDAPSVAA